jgi:diguanylate cyclase (GGDEF)-like protein
MFFVPAPPISMKRRPVYQANRIPSAGPGPASPGDATHPDEVHPDHRDPVRLVLERTLSITTATSESQLLTRTLATACDLSGATFAAAVNPDGSLQSHGDPELAARFAGADRSVAPGSAAAAPTAALASAGSASAASASAAVASARLRSAGLPYAVTATFGDTVIVAASKEPGRLAAHAASLLELVVAHACAARERLRELDQLSRRADSDPLTGLHHNRPFEARLRSSRPGSTAIIAVDVDDFKKINDEYGHQAGDHALLSLVEGLRSVLRDDDQLYRIGGDEFAVVVEVDGPDEVVAIARRLLTAARRVGQTVSVGAALHMVGETGRDTLSRADKALYQAKRAGRDTARLAPSRAHAA